MARLHKNVKELADRVEEIGWHFTGKNDGGGHPVFRHDSGREYAIVGTPSDWRSLKNCQANMERMVGQKVTRHGKHQKSRKKFEGSGFSLEIAAQERDAFHQKTDLLPATDLWTQRRDLIDRILVLVKMPPSPEAEEEAKTILWKIRATERGLKNLGQTYREFDLMDLPLDPKVKEAARRLHSTRHAAPKPDAQILKITERARANAQKKRKTVTDDFDGRSLVADTEPWRVEIMGKTYDLMLAPENRLMVEEFLTNLVDGAKKVRKTKPRTRSEASRDAALNQHARSPEGDDPKVIRAWLRENGFPDVKDRGRFSHAQIHAWENRNARSRREAAKRSAAAS